MKLEPLEGPINGYVELASPQMLDDKWKELDFDIASGHNILQDLVVPEAGGGYVYHDSHVVGSPTQNRFIYWRTAGDVLELVEISTEEVLEGSQLRIRFSNSPVINNISVIELSDSIVVMVATTASVHRWTLPHPKTIDRSVLHELTSEVLFNPSNYYLLNNQTSPNTQQPICATSWSDRSMLKCALSFPDSSLLIVQFSQSTHHVTTCDIRQIGIIGRLWSRMPNLLARHPNDCDNAIFASAPYHLVETNDVLLFTLCRDCRIRIFSVNSRECVATHNMIPQSSFSASFASHTNLTTEPPMMKVLGSRIVIYLTENRPEFVLLDYTFEDGTHTLRERSTIQAPSWEKLIDFSITEGKLWALAHLRETETILCFTDLRDVIEGGEAEAYMLDEIWEFVNLEFDLDLPAVKSYVSEIFWRNRFSIATIQKALIGFTGPSIPKQNTMEALEELAHTRIVDDNQEEAWAKFYNYCLQNHQAANKNICLVACVKENVISVVKRSNPSFVCPWLEGRELVSQNGPYRGIEFPSGPLEIFEALDFISTDFIDDERSTTFEDNLFESPAHLMETIDDIVKSSLKSKELSLKELYSKLSVNRARIRSSIDYICTQLDLTDQAREFGLKVLQESSSRMRSEHHPLKSNSGIIATFELFKRLVRARMILARDLLIYIHVMTMVAQSEESSTQDKFYTELFQDLHLTSKVRTLQDSLRSYALLVWATETPVKKTVVQDHSELINFVADKFKFFKDAGKAQDSALDSVLSQNLFMNFLVNGGVKFSSTADDISGRPQTLSNSFYVTETALNLCRLMWPKTNHLCFAEFLFTHQLDEHLDKYLNITEEWLDGCEYDRHFMRACNSLLQNRATLAVDLFDRLWTNMTHTNLLGRFINLDEEKPDSASDDKVSITPNLIYRYYDKLIQLFQIYNSHPSLVILINQCMSLLDANDNDQKHWINCFRAKLFQYYLELEEPDEAYHTMVLTSDPSLRINCLRKFIVSHCEKEQWTNLLSYPFIDIKNDFIDILNQKAESSDLSKLNGSDFYKTSYYDLLFSSYISDDEFQKGASIMYSFAQRLAHEVPGMISIRKQVDCLLIALNALRCCDEEEAFIDFGSSPKDEGRCSVLKRAYDCESEISSRFEVDEEDSTTRGSTSRVFCRDIKMNYELSRARLKLLEKDQTANAIALSPLKPEETISQLIASSMFPAAIDLALLFRTSMDAILEGLTAKYIFITRLSTVDIAVHQDLERGLSEIFTDSYSNIDTYNYIASSTSSFAEKLWRLIEYYLNTYDGISHRYNSTTFSGTFSGTTVLMRIVATKLLSAGFNIPASLKRMYMSRNTAELLKLLIKFDKLIDAADLATEMINKTMEPTFTSEPPPVYLPTHLILLLITYLNEDATNTSHVKVANDLTERLNRFRQFVS